MEGKVILLTGVPAVGKTTLARAIDAIITPLHIISFGEMILEVKLRYASTTTYKELRTNPTQVASSKLIQEASDLLLQQVTKLRTKSNIIIDSHAVAKDNYGFRVTPDSALFLQEIQLNAILVLHTNYKQVATRINANAEGRRVTTPAEVATHEALQDMVAVSYAVASGCPVFVVDANYPPSLLVEKVLVIFDAIDMEYTRVEEKRD